MDSFTTQQFRQRLLDERRQLLARIAQQRGGTVSRVEMAAQHDLRASDASAQARTELDEALAMNEHETAELSLFDHALDRLDQGLYGQCMDCGVEISLRRLQVYPLALRCMTCQSAQESRH
ncbi:MAG: TraR/DksA family transcriptional regulator [Limnohabitans sp.]